MILPGGYMLACLGQRVVSIMIIRMTEGPDDVS